MRAGISFHGGELEAELRGELWTVRLGELEATSRWLDFALSQVLDDDPRRVHELAAKLIEQMLVERAPRSRDHSETEQPPR